MFWTPTTLLSPLVAGPVVLVGACANAASIRSPPQYRLAFLASLTETIATRIEMFYLTTNVSVFAATKG